MKTIIFINLRFAHFYSKELIKQIKRDKPIRFVAIVDQQFKDNIPAHISPFLDEIYLLPAKAKDGFLAEFDIDLLRLIVHKEQKLTSDIRLVCLDEFNLLNTGRLRRELSIPGNTDHDLLPYRDKVKMKNLLIQHNLRVPKFKPFSMEDRFVRLSKDFGLPFVIKPADSCGSHGVSLIFNELDFNRCQENLTHVQDIYEVEEYIEGDLYHVDSFTRQGEIQFICANEYTCPNYHYTHGKALGSIPMPETNELGKQLICFAKKCLQALGSKNLINHMEIFVTAKKELIFLEVSARPPGALINLTHRINFGINLTDEDFFMQTDEYVSVLHEKKLEQACWMLFPLQPGRVKDRRAPRVKSRMDLTWFVDKGRWIAPGECKNILGKSAQVILYNADYAALRNDFDKIKHHTTLEMNNG